MKPQIITLKFDLNRCYVIRGKQSVLIDGGPPRKKCSFLRQLEKHGIPPQEIRLIVLTHGDFDHIGSAKYFLELTGAKIAIHENDRIYLEKGLFHWPPGITRWGKISRFLLVPLLKAIYRIPPVKSDIILDDNEFPLEYFGIDGKIISTPGHTGGSVSVLLDTGEAFAGCMAQNSLPFTLKPRFPIYAEDIRELQESWKLLKAKGAKIIYPGHGNPFPVEAI